MNTSAVVSNQQYVLERKNPQTGFKETVVYTGSLKQKPSGWKQVQKSQGFAIAPKS